MAKTGSPTAEAPVNSKNFSSIPPAFAFTVSTSNATPRPARTGQTAKPLKRTGDLPIGGMNIVQTAIAKTPTIAQNIIQINFPFISAHL